MGQDIELRSLYSECHRRALFTDFITGFPIFQPHVEKMYRARTYEVTEGPIERILYITDPVVDFDMVAESFVPFLDRALLVMKVGRVTVLQGGRSWCCELDRGNWYLSEENSYRFNNCSFDFI
jgi:hypothetical protein